MQVAVSNAFEEEHQGEPGDDACCCVRIRLRGQVTMVFVADSEEP
jgi:hypothetical protein